MSAARRPLGCHIQSPPPPYKGDEEHHGFQQGPSRESFLDESYGWAEVWFKQQPDPVSARRNYRIQLDVTRRPSSGETFKASDSPYHSVNRQLDKALKTLTRQQEASAHQLAGVHRHYEGLLTQYETKQPSTPNA
jgi:hypothetical protein